MNILRLIITFIVLTSCFNNIYAEWVPFELKNNHITIDIKFNGIDATAVLDTGASINAVSSYFVDKYGNGIHKAGKINVTGVSGVRKRQIYSNIPINLFGVDIVLNKMTEMSLGGHAILLGAPFFSQFIIQLDYPNSRMQLLPKESIDLNKYKNVNIKRQKGSSLPAIEVSVDGKKFWLMLDTGNNGGILVKRNFAERNGWLNTNTTVHEGQIRGVNSATYVQNFSIPSFKIGPYELENVTVTVPAEGEKITVGNRYRSAIKKLSGKNTRGILGYDILKHFVLTIDYSSYKAHITAP